jgi:hypothetical protein
MSQNKWSGVDAVIASRFLDGLAKLNHDFVRSFSPDQRDAWANLMSTAVNSIVIPRPVPDEAISHADQLREHGLSMLGQLLTPDEVQEMKQNLLLKPIYNTHIYEPYVSSSANSDGVPRLIGSGAEKFRFGAYSFEDIMTTPHIIRLATHPKIVGVARAHLGTQPTVYSINIWWSFPGHEVGSSDRDGQTFHRDKDYGRFCAAFIYLTDVDKDSGPHHYLEYSHDVKATERVISARAPALPAANLFNLPQDNYGLDPVYNELWKDHLKEIVGPAGTVFLANTYGLHRGRHPVARPRLMVWVRYSAFAGPPEHTRVKRSQLADPYPEDEHLRYMLRSIVEEE